MSDLQIANDGRYIAGDIPFGYRLWGDRLIEVPQELDACVTAIRLVKQGKAYPEIAPALRTEHGVGVSRAQFDTLMRSASRRYGPI